MTNASFIEVLKQRGKLAAEAAERIATQHRFDRTIGERAVTPPTYRTQTGYSHRQSGYWNGWIGPGQ